MLTKSENARRLEIITPYLVDKNREDACKRFNNLDIMTLDRLLYEGLISGDSCQNFSPTAQEFANFMHMYPFITAHGYIIIEPRVDARITIEGIEGSYKDMSNPTEFLIDFVSRFRHADEFEISELDSYVYVWWD